MAALWFEELAGPSVWHLGAQRVDDGWYRMACGWELRIRDARRLWPVKPPEVEPEEELRCRSCVEMST